MAERGCRPRALGEIAIRTRNMAAMAAFQRDVIGLEVLAERNGGKILIFRIADGCAGHSALLALFEHTGQIAGGGAAATGAEEARGTSGAAGAAAATAATRATGASGAAGALPT